MSVTQDIRQQNALLRQEISKVRDERHRRFLIVTKSVAEYLSRVFPR